MPGDVAAIGEGESTLLSPVDAKGDPVGITGVAHRSLAAMAVRPRSHADESARPGLRPLKIALEWTLARRDCFPLHPPAAPIFIGQPRRRLQPCVCLCGWRRRIDLTGRQLLDSVGWGIRERPSRRACVEVV